MSWIIIPAFFFILILIGLILYNKLNEPDWAFLIVIVSSFAFIIAIISCPIQYYGDRSKSWAMQQYYESIVQPNIIEEYEDYVVVDDLTSGVWQAGGETTLYDYNAYLVTNRHWQTNIITKTIVYPAPKELKYVRIKGK